MTVDPVVARDKLRRALASGEKHVQFGDEIVTYRDVDELFAALAVFEAEIALANQTTRPRRWLLSGSKGT